MFLEQGAGSSASMEARRWGPLAVSAWAQLMFCRPYLQPVAGSPVWLHLVAAEQEANASCGCAPAVEYSADGGRELVALL